MIDVKLFIFVFSCLIFNSLSAQTTILLDGQPVGETIFICPGENLQLEATGAETYAWSPANIFADPTSSIVTLAPEERLELTVVGTQVDGTTSLDGVVINIDDFDFNFVMSVDGEESDSMDLIIDCDLELRVESSANNLTYEWFRDNNTIANETGSVYTENLQTEGSFNYEVIAISDNGCTKGDNVTFSVRPPRLPMDDEQGLIPNVFTPNGDELNDFFAPYLEKGLSIEDLKIYNRWGQCVYDNTNGDEGWDGTFDNADAPADVYIYTITIKLPDDEEQQFFSKRGEVTLLR
ncbi:MAG: gliding motility-associated C-terminal domain-containing protein [Saprospiraceae bacterium]